MDMVRAVTLAFVLSSVLLGGCQWADSTSSVHPSPAARLNVAPGWSARICEWEHMLHLAARHDSSTAYPTPGPGVFRERVARAGSRYGFQVVSLHFERAPQGAPFLIIQTASSPATLSREVPAIMRLLDPHRPAEQDWQGWAYEGIFLGAQSSRGRPILDVFNVMRLHSGGQWARTPNLYPYAHG
jgi:hypothetical protein